jgi:hypothetical protein
LFYINKFNQRQLKSYQFQINTDYQFKSNLESLNKEQTDFLKIAAIASNEMGVFNLDVVTSIAGIERRLVINFLDELQKRHLIIDLIEEDKIDLYKFSDLETIKLISKEEDIDNQYISQSTREYYKSYVKFFIPFEDWSQNRNHILKSVEIGLISERELTLLAIRALKTSEFLFIHDLVEFVLQEIIENAISTNFTGAETLIKKYRLKFKESRFRIDIDWHEFNLCVENGKSERACELFEGSIRQSLNDGKLTSRHLLVCVRYCFDNFNIEGNEELGSILNNTVLLNSKSTDLEKLRARFYSSKLIPNKNKNCSKLENFAFVNQVIKTYDELLELLDKNKSSDLSLLKEVLNDYIGFFSDSVWPKNYRHNLEGLQLDLVKTKIRLDELIRFRLNIEGLNYFTEDWLDVTKIQRGTSIDYRGLCYTYNYIQRGLFNLDDYSGSIQVGVMSFTLNSFVGDNRGKQVCAGYLSQANLKITNYKAALYWAEQSVGYCHVHLIRIDAAINNLFEVCNAIKDLKSFWSLSRMISKSHLLKHFDEGTPNSEKNSTLMKPNSIKVTQSEIGSKFYWNEPLNFDLLFSLVEKLQQFESIKVGLTFNYEGMEIIIIECISIDSKINMMLKFPMTIGTTNVIQIDNEYDVKFVQRGIHKVPVIEGVLPKETNICSLVIQTYELGKIWNIVTAFPGDMAPPYPNEKQSTKEHQISEDYWKSHAFAIDRKTLTKY